MKSKNYYILSDSAKEFLVQPSKNKLFRILSEKILLFSEIYALFSTPKNCKEILEIVKDKYFSKYKLNWSTTKQIQHRLDFYLALDLMNVIYDGKIKKFSKKENLNYILSNNNSKSLEEPIPNTLRIENKNKLSFFDENDIKKKDLYF